MSDSEAVTVEATGETVGEAKWAALRELELLVPGLDRESVEFQVVSEGERGLLGVGFTPAQVMATVVASRVNRGPSPAWRKMSRSSSSSEQPRRSGPMSRRPRPRTKAS